MIPVPDIKINPLAFFAALLLTPVLLATPSWLTLTLLGDPDTPLLFVLNLLLLGAALYGSPMFFTFGALFFWIYLSKYQPFVLALALAGFVANFGTPIIYKVFIPMLPLGESFANLQDGWGVVFAWGFLFAPIMGAIFAVLYRLITKLFWPAKTIT